MNKRKAEAMWFGRDKNNAHHQYHNLKWVKQITILGIHFNSSVKAQNIDVNWESKIDNMKQTMKLWS